MNLPSFAKTKRWVSKGLLAVLDQVLISGANFAISILLARWSSAEDYGAFALAFSVFLLLSQAHQALLLEPMSVFGTSLYRSRTRQYLGELLQMHTVMAVGILIILAVCAAMAVFVWHSPLLGSSLLGVSIAAPCVLLFWLARRGFYLKHEPAPAAGAALFYTVAILGGLYVTRLLGVLTPFRAFIVMAGGALATSAVMLLVLKPKFTSLHDHADLREAGRQHWEYGRWALLGALAMWIPYNIYYPVLSLLRGIDGAADIKALINLAAPTQRITVALALLLLPYIARITRDEGVDAAAAATKRVAWVFGAGAIAYWALVTAFRHEVVLLLYGGKYDNLQHLIPALAVSSILQAIAAAIVIGLRAIRSPVSVFIAYSASMAASVTIGIAATWLWGLMGVIIGIAVSNLAAMVVAFALLKRCTSQQHVVSRTVVAPVVISEAKAS
jgi:O-antigen/teichoic acid export membrane protein